MQIDDIPGIIRREIVRQGTNPFRLAVSAGLPENSIRTILNGHEPKAGRLIEICRALGLEFYIGPPRNGADQTDTEGLTTKTLAARLDAIHADLRAMRGAPLEDDAALADAAASDDASPVNVMSLAAAAGAGAGADGERVIGRRWFQRGWLAERGLDAKSCVVIGVKGESMEPTLPDGCSILVDYASRRLRPGQIFVLRGDDGLIAKRAAEDDGTWRFVSDHPAWEDIPWTPPDHEVVGQVVWMARTLI